jgi:FAD:protein FMN transferase
MSFVTQRSTWFALLAAACLIAVFWFVRHDSATTVLRLEGSTMGTTWSVLLGERSTGVDPADLQLQLQQELDLINKRMSTYDQTSEISRFNDSSTTDWFPVSPETVQVVELARKISTLSNGAFDVTVGPLVDMWGFGPRPRGERRPTDSQVEMLLKQVGYRHLSVRRDPAALRKDVPGLRVDLSAIAKGYGVDRLAEVLVAKGFTNMVVEIGGEMVLKGRNPNGKLWRIAVEKPLPGQRSVERVFLLTDTGMATSGDYRNFFTENGQRFSHTIDPATGRPARNRLASATVLAPTSAEADALATALMAMGDERAREFCRREKIAAYLLIHQGDGIQAIMTENFNSVTSGAES